MAFFLNAEENVLGRYGGRDAKSADGRLSLAGLRHAMEAARAARRLDPAAKPEPRVGLPVRAEEYAAAKRQTRGECIHCHQVYEFRRADLKSAGKWNKQEVWVYPLPENVGLTLDVDRGNRVTAVSADSPAERAGIRAGDSLETVNGTSVASMADAQYGLHRAPPSGQVSVTWSRDGHAMKGTLELRDGWRKTNITWRPSLLDILVAFEVFGDDLTVAEKSAVGLPEKRLAFRQDSKVPKSVQDAGVRAGDVIIGIDGQLPEMSVSQFLGYVRQHYLTGEKITLHILRDGKRIDLPMTLR